MPAGNPTTYTGEIADTLCGLLAEGTSVRTACKVEGMPCPATVFNWLRTNDKFLEQYTRAKAESADYLVDEMLDIADDSTNDYMENQDASEGSAGWRLNGENIQRSRVRIDTRKWIASKLKPKKYGDKIALTGEDGGPVRVNIERKDADL